MTLHVYTSTLHDSCRYTATDIVCAIAIYYPADALIEASKLVSQCEVGRTSKVLSWQEPQENVTKQTLKSIGPPEMCSYSSINWNVPGLYELHAKSIVV